MSATLVAAVRSPERLLRRLAVEEFLYEEAALLDAWRLDDWLGLLTEDTRYVVPATDLPDGDPRVTLGLIDDDLTRLGGRVERLKSAKAYREFPWSRTRRIIGNVRLVDDPGLPPGELEVTSSFAAFRYRKGDEQTLVGTYHHRLREGADGDLRIAVKRVVLDVEALRPHGTLSIIL